MRRVIPSSRASCSLSVSRDILNKRTPGSIFFFQYKMSGEAHPKRWLIAYNSISAALWSVVLFNTAFLGLAVGQPFLFEKTAVITTAIQCCAVIEIYNSAAGHVKSPIFTTTTQVFSRLMIVLGIMTVLPNSPANYHWCYATLCLSWSITEIIRYSYYSANLKDPGAVSPTLTWLRYTTFYVLYPTGVSSELAMIYFSLGEATSQVGSWYAWFLKLIMLTYAPGFYMLYTYMIKQRKKVLGPKAKTEKNKKVE